MKEIIFAACTYNQNDNLKNLYESVKCSYPTVNESNFYIFNNHSNYIHPGPAKAFHNTLRPDWSTGYLSRSWNQAILWGFQSTIAPQTEWICLLQGDVMLHRDWYSTFQTMVRNNVKFFAAGPGDQTVFIHIDAFRKIGFWDERFAGIGYHEFDYFIRAFLRMGKQAAIEGHGDQLNWNWTDLPLIERQSGDRSGHTMRLNPQLYGHLARKWGRELIEQVCHPHSGGDSWTSILEEKFGRPEARNSILEGEIPKEYNWYPYIYRNDPNNYSGIYYDYVSIGEMETWVDMFDKRFK